VVVVASQFGRGILLAAAVGLCWCPVYGDNIAVAVVKETKTERATRRKAASFSNRYRLRDGA
jgi:hypothetical protein